MSVADWFRTFCDNIRICSDDESTIRTRYHQITKRINIEYYGSTSDTAHSLYIGSYGRDTEIYKSDIDMLVQLPYTTYEKFNGYSSNGQSQLLQEVKNALAKTYSITKLKGDGQIISLPFQDAINFEVLPTFVNKDGSYTYPNSNNGGSWKTTNPKAEISAIKEMNDKCNNNLKPLCRMMRAWKNRCGVDISGILIDILAHRFILTWSERDKSFLYYDWMSRDFFKFLSEQDPKQTLWQVMGSGRYIYHSSSYVTKAKTAYNIAVEATDKGSDYPTTAKSKWREIYGTKFPL